MMHALYLVTAAAVGAASQSVIPAPFRGVWDASAEACAGEHSDLRIRIDEHSIEYWESGGIAKAVSTAGENDIRVTWAMSGEEEEWTSRTRFVIASSGDHLFAESLPQEGEEFHPTTWVYERCPEGTPMGWGGAS